MLIGELEACMLGNQSRFVVHILRRGISLMSQKRKALMIPSKLDSISLTKTYLFQFPPSLRLTYQLFVTHCSVLLVYIRISFSIVIFLKDWHFWQKWPFSDQKKWHFKWPNQNSKTTFMVRIFPKYGPYAFIS